jgi:hypothetical protein
MDRLQFPEPRASAWRSILAILSLAATAFALPASANSKGGPIDLDLYAQILEQNTEVTKDIAEVRVDYRSIGSTPEWRDLVSQIEKAKPSRLDRDGQIAFWINAYNILTIDLILKHYPIESIKDIGSFFSPVWNIQVATIEGKDLSLGEIEHDILRPMGEPRIHAAIVCASASCPPLARSPFRPDQLEHDLSLAMRVWLRNQQKVIKIDRGAGRITLSKIFDWFEADFEASGGVFENIARYVDQEDSEWLRTTGNNASIEYFKYDWSLNDLKR